MKRCFLYIGLLLLVFSCQQQDFSSNEEQLIVEAWIDEGGAPYVHLTTSFNPSPDPKPVSSLLEQIYASAKVSISDGSQTVILTGLASRHYYPPFVYTSARMTGKAGKTYTLTVESERFHASATATIPPSRELDEICVVPFGEDPLQRMIQARFHDNPDTEDYYMSFVRIEKADSSFVPSLMTLTADSVTGSGEIPIIIRPGSSVARSERREAYRKGERVRIKFRTMEEPVYRIWKHIAEQNAFSSVPFFLQDQNLPGNVDGAIGYFAAYGCSDYLVTIPE